MSRKRVVVTGMGMLSPVGNTMDETWSNLLAAKSGVANITHFDTEGFGTHFSASVKNFDLSHYLPPKEGKKMDLFIQYGMAAGIQAIRMQIYKLPTKMQTASGSPLALVLGVCP